MTEPKNAVTKASASRLSEMLQRYDRKPFLDVTEMLLRNAPSEEVVQELAKTSPQHWAAILKVMATLGGFADQKVVTHRRELDDMSEMELVEFIRNGRHELLNHYEAQAAKKLEAIDVEAVPVPKDKT